MATALRRRLILIGKGLLMILIVLCGAWGVLALSYRAPGGLLVKGLLVGLWVVLMIVVAVLIWRGRVALAVLVHASAFGALLLWWMQLAPSNDRIWAADVAETLTGTVDGNRVTLHNVRNFEWRSNTDFTPRWETRRYDLDHLASVDMILSYWSSASIAHMIVSFGFDDGEHVAFSVEIRREQDEAFSEIGGFFKQFELGIIAADESDVIAVRTNVRGEDGYLYRIQMPAAARRSLLLAYLAEANDIAARPRFYHTISANCTTLVFHMLKHIVGHLPLDYRLLMTGYLPEYVYKVGGLDRRQSLAELTRRGHITERAREAGNGRDFSAAIRRADAP